MPSEPDWSKEISNSSVCSWFYALAILNAIFAVAGVVRALFLSKSNGLTLPLLITGSVGFINAWALFLVCNRGLQNEGFAWNWNPQKMRDQLMSMPKSSWK